MSSKVGTIEVPETTNGSAMTKTRIGITITNATIMAKRAQFPK